MHRVALVAVALVAAVAGECVDKKWYKKSEKRTCAWVAKKHESRCELSKAKQKCPVACGECDPCEDDKKFKTEGKSCRKIGKMKPSKQRTWCEKKGTSGKSKKKLKARVATIVAADHAESECTEAGCRCFCQDECACLAEPELGSTLVVPRGFALPGPLTCGERAPTPAPTPPRPTLDWCWFPPCGPRPSPAPTTPEPSPAPTTAAPTPTPAPTVDGPHAKIRGFARAGFDMTGGYGGATAAATTAAEFADFVSRDEPLVVTIDRHLALDDPNLSSTYDAAPHKTILASAT
ncbi:pectate lyase [Aureococcus anophagefferens]|nr:pectate lyase [Aureococcus anophagefferens]